MSISQENMSEIKRHFTKAQSAFEGMNCASDAEQLRTAWEGFLDEFCKAMGKLISATMKNGTTRAWAHRLKRASQKDDEGLIFIREARNVSVHGLTPFAVFEEPRVNIGQGAILVSGDSKNITIENNIIDGQPTGDFILSTKGGKVESLVGNPNPDMELNEVDAEIMLVTVLNEENGKISEVPKMLGGQKLDCGRPSNLAEVALAFLETKIDEVKIV